MNGDEVMRDLAEQNATLQTNLAAAQAEVAQLHVALESARRIGAAMGIIMATLKVVEDVAFDVLRTASQNTNCKLRDVADDVVRTGVLPDPWD